MRPHLRRLALLGLTFGIAICAAAGPLNFLFFWRKPPQPRGGVSKMLRPDQQVELADLLSMAPAKQKCENWAWAAAVESILRAQEVPLAQSYWVTKADGGEVCKESATDLSAATPSAWSSPSTTTASTRSLLSSERSSCRFDKCCSGRAEFRRSSSTRASSRLKMTMGAYYVSFLVPFRWPAEPKFFASWLRLPRWRRLGLDRSAA